MQPTALRTPLRASEATMLSQAFAVEWSIVKPSLSIETQAASLTTLRSLLIPPRHLFDRW